ncbi:uracil-DNA glycosylase family protein [Haladaptatus sp. GCM10025707]|uniref:uracil-DNA glycosylase n=1 Tax=unclassified Haladaptatus TaxID=2622732 RepID=UPI0023E8664B|nr:MULTISPECIES: uracil-DNA glycosylase family protein [unclassified Haladaptatus]
MVPFPDPTTRNELVADCRRCPALVEARECIAWGNGPLDATLVVIGEAPAAGDSTADTWKGGNWTGMAYTSRHSGRTVRRLMADLGYGPEDCYYTNAAKCYPKDGESNRAPRDTELANCRSHLVDELSAIRPHAVLTTGKHATRSVLAMESIALDGFLDAVLTPIDCPTLEVTLLPLLHPSYQAVWLSRLDFTYESYLEAIRTQLDGFEA